MEFVADSDPNAAKKINDAEDLEDTLDVMETIVDQLKQDITNKMDLEVAMNQYINLEDQIIDGIRVCIENAKKRDVQEQIITLVENFNTFGANY